MTLGAYNEPLPWYVIHPAPWKADCGSVLDAAGRFVLVASSVGGAIALCAAIDGWERPPSLPWHVADDEVSLLDAAGNRLAHSEKTGLLEGIAQKVNQRWKWAQGDAEASPSDTQSRDFAQLINFLNQASASSSQLSMLAGGTLSQLAEAVRHMAELCDESTWGEEVEEGGVAAGLWGAVGELDYAVSVADSAGKR